MSVHRHPLTRKSEVPAPIAQPVEPTGPEPLAHVIEGEHIAPTAAPPPMSGRKGKASDAKKKFMAVIDESERPPAGREG